MQTGERKRWSILQQATFNLPKPPESLKRFPGPFPSILLNVNPIPPYLDISELLPLPNVHISRERLLGVLHSSCSK